MGKRALKNRKIHIVAVGAALATGCAVITLLPSANAAEVNAAPQKTPEQIMQMCQHARVVNGEQQELRSSFESPGFLADSCDYVETKPLERFNGPTEKASIDYPNCEPNSTGPSPAGIEWNSSVGQGQGRYTVTQQGVGGGLFGVLNLSWTKHEGTLDMTVRTVGASDSEVRQVPVGKVLHMDFTPRMQRMTGVWRVRIDAREATTTTNAVPEQVFEAPEVVEGPVILSGAAGAPGVAAGVAKPVLTDC